ncbi:MAG: hypothetical protein CVT64_11125, partial [Actinobacteria bacterium HGW-Actinobacteria-4]
MTATLTTTRNCEPLAGTVARRLVVADVENLLGRAPAEASALEWALAVGHLFDAIGLRRGSDMVAIAVNPVFAIHVAALYGSMSLGLRVAAHRTVWVPRTSRVELGLA